MNSTTPQAHLQTASKKEDNQAWTSETHNQRTADQDEDGRKAAWEGEGKKERNAQSVCSVLQQNKKDGRESEREGRKKKNRNQIENKESLPSRPEQKKNRGQGPRNTLLPQTKDVLIFLSVPPPPSQKPMI